MSIKSKTFTKLMLDNIWNMKDWKNAKKDHYIFVVFSTPETKEMILCKKSSFRKAFSSHLTFNYCTNPLIHYRISSHLEVFMHKSEMKIFLKISKIVLNFMTKVDHYGAKFMKIYSVCFSNFSIRFWHF